MWMNEAYKWNCDCKYTVIYNKNNMLCSCPTIWLFSVAVHV
jgi:hypothetical protein